MSTALAKVKESAGDDRLILQNRREMLLSRIKDIQFYNEETNKKGSFGMLIAKTDLLFTKLCKSKFGLSLEQLKKLSREELDELAVIVYEQSKRFCFIETAFLAIIPIIGWVCLWHNQSPKDMPAYNAIMQNQRYCWYYRRVEKLSGKKFSPQL